MIEGNVSFHIMIKHQLTTLTVATALMAAAHAENNFGEEVYNENDVQLHSNYSTKVDLSNYAKGLYYLYIYSDEVNYVEKVIVK